LRKSSETPDDEFDDAIKPEDGLERHWLYFNGETYRLYAFIASLFFLACLGALYLLCKSDSTVGVAAAILAAACFMAGIGIGGRLRLYQDKGWKKDWRTPREERIERRVALYLWLFIFISVGAIILSQWTRGRFP